MEAEPLVQFVAHGKGAGAGSWVHGGMLAPHRTSSSLDDMFNILHFEYSILRQ